MNIPVFLIAFILSAIIHYGIQKVFIYYKKFDDFNHRSFHKTLATRTGGIGIFLTVLIIALYHYFQKVELFDYSLFIPLGIMFVVGVYDDFYNADFKLKFFLQIIVAKILIDQGYVITNYHGLFGLYEIPWLLAQLSTIFVFIVIVNAINFIDGIDGLAISESIKTLILIEFLSVSFTSLAPMSMILIASILPLYYFNFKKERKVFLGDGGSLLLGTLIAIYIFYILRDAYTLKADWTINKTLFAVLVLLYPLVDLLRVFALRIKEGKSPFVADQRHLHHLLSRKTKNNLTTVFIIEFISLTVFGLFIYLIAEPF